MNSSPYYPQNIDKLTLSLVPDKSRVLELGCSIGSMGHYLEKNHNCIVTGVEINKDNAYIANKKMNRAICGDLNDISILRKIKNYAPYDVIFASAILEHLENPQLVVKSLKSLLKLNGFFIITLPNIAYWQIRINLLFGKFDYQNSGILDKTHLKFFTLKTAQEFIVKDCKLQLTNIYFELPHLPVVHHLSKLELFLQKKFPGLFAYQFLLKARPK